MRIKKITECVGLTAALILGATLCAQAQEQEKISEGVYVGSIDLGGKTPEEARELIEEQIYEMSSCVVTLKMGDDAVTATLGSLGLTWENPELVDQISLLGTTGNIVTRYKEKKDLQNQNVHFSIEYALDETKEREFIAQCNAFNSEPAEGHVYMGDDGYLYVDGGTDGLTLLEEPTLGTFNEVISDWEIKDYEITAEVSRKSPMITAETLSDMNHVLGTATTDYSASSWARSQNIANATGKINGSLLMPGESYSVTAAVVPFTAENGYELAPSYESGQVVETYGGGICQVSTTLYNALLKAELQIDARSNHTMTVSYVSPSKDAAIAEGLMDLVFTNSLDSPVYIAGSAYSGTLTFSVYGKETRPENRTLEFVSEVTSRTDVSGSVKLVARTDQNAGYINQVQTPHEGLTAVLWKNVYYDGVLSDTIQVNSSYYEATPATYEVGVATSNSYLSSALYSAIAQNSLQAVQNALTSAQQAAAKQQAAAAQQQAQQTPAGQ